ncbi:MAG: lipopolysaccharide kinase InaA family protein [Verrucomicrobiota bacterium]
MNRFHLAPELASWIPPEHRDSLENLAAFLGLDLASHDHRTKIVEATLTAPGQVDRRLFFKVYASRRKPLEGWFRRAPALREAGNLNRFARWGLPTPEVIGYGCQSPLPWKHHLSWILTDAIPDAPSLLQFWTGLDQPGDSALRLTLIEKTARQTRTLHDHHFCHRDLHWRNLLIRGDDVYWIDCPKGYVSGLPVRQKHGRIKDLATLDKTARERCTAKERLFFLQVYLGETSPTDRVKALAAQVTTYRRKRFD